MREQLICIQIAAYLNWPTRNIYCKDRPATIAGSKRVNNRPDLAFSPGYDNTWPVSKFCLSIYIKLPRGTSNENCTQHSAGDALHLGQSKHNPCKLSQKLPKRNRQSRGNRPIEQPLSFSHQTSKPPEPILQPNKTVPLYSIANQAGQPPMDAKAC